MLKIRLAAIVALVTILIGAVGCGSSGEPIITRSGTGVIVPAAEE